MADLITVTVWGQTLEMETDPALFSPRGADRGTMAMLELSCPQPGDRVLDLGCGYGLSGLAAAKVLSPDRVVMVDIDPLAVRVARGNAVRNGLAGVRIIGGDGPDAAAPELFSLILCNPPYHADFSVARRFIEQSRGRLLDGGRLVMVVKRLAWYQNKMASVFGGVRVKISGGYYVLTSEKRPETAGADSGNRAASRNAATTRKHRKKLDTAAAQKKKPGPAPGRQTRSMPNS